MRKLTLALAAIIVILMFSASQAEEIYHQRAIEIKGGLAYFLDAGDPVDWPKTFVGSNVGDEMLYSPAFGISVLYRTHNNFVWNLGYNYMLSSSTNYTVGVTAYEETVSASEIYAMAGFIINPSGRLNLSLTTGPTLTIASMDRISPAAGTLREFYGANGKSIGILAMANLEYLLRNDLGIKLGAGFRGASISNLGFVDSNEQQHDVMWTTPAGAVTPSSYTIDFSGFFAEFGFRFYLTPKDNW